jgi:hypothetical protein
LAWALVAGQTWMLCRYATINPDEVGRLVCHLRLGKHHSSFGEKKIFFPNGLWCLFGLGAGFSRLWGCAR